MKQLYRTLTILVLPLLVAACNTDYNFDNISLEVTVGNTEGISVPLGTVEKITVGELMKESGLEPGEDGFYGFEDGGHFEYTAEVGTLAPITGLAPALDPITESLFGGFSAKIEPFYGKKDLAIPGGLTGGMTLTESLINMMGVRTLPMKYDPHTFEENFTIELPEEVASLEEVTFGADGKGSHLKVQFDLGGLAGVSQSCNVKSLYFELPEGFVINKVVGDPLYDDIHIGPSNHFEIKDHTFTGSHILFDIVLEKVVLDHITIENHVATIKENVTFALDATVAVQPGEIATVSPYVEMNVQPVIYDATIKTNEITHSFSFEEPIKQSVEIPEIVSRIDYLSISKKDDATAKPQFSVDVALSGSPIEVLELRDVEITLPAFLDIETPEGWNYEAGKLSAERLEVRNGTTNHIIDLTLNGISGLEIVEGQISLDSAVALKGTVAVAADSELHIGTSAQELSLVPTVTVDDMAIQEVTGLIDPDLSELMPTQEISLGNFTSALEGLEMDLNIESPLLSVTVVNPVGVGIDATISLTPYKGTEVGESVYADIHILPATTTNILLAGDASRAEGVTVVEGLTELITSLPEKIVVEFAAETNKDKPHTLTLEDSYTFTVDYAVEAAFKFDAEKDGTIDYTVEVEDVDLSMLSDINVIVENITVKVASESTLPIDLTMDVELLDENDAPIECITSSTEGTIEGSTTSEPKLSECDIVLNIATPAPQSSEPSPFAQIARTKKVRCTLHGTTLAGGGLRPDQYISAKLSLLLEEGITVDLGTLLPEEEKPEPNQPEPNQPENPTE